MAVDTGRLPLLLRWCGLALVAAGVLMVVATLLHPSRETATTIVASEPRLVAAHEHHHARMLRQREREGLAEPAARAGQYQAALNAAHAARRFSCRSARKISP